MPKQDEEIEMEICKNCREPFIKSVDEAVTMCEFCFDDFFTDNIEH